MTELVKNQSEFHPVTLADMHWLKPLLLKSDSKCCEYTFGNLFIWQPVSCIKVRAFEGGALVRFDCDYPCYLFPIGCESTQRALEEIERDEELTGSCPRIIAASSQDAETAVRLFPGKYIVEPTPDYGEYIYDAEELAQLPGKKFHQKRNFVSRFERENEGWSFKPFSPNDKERLLEVNQRWYDHQIRDLEKVPNSIIHEHLAVVRAIENYEVLELQGGYIELADGTVAAFSIGEPMSREMYCVHIEKALTEYTGSYAVINREFVRHFCGGFKYVNREDAAGIEGLIKAKQSYCPVEVTEKFKISKIGAETGKCRCGE